MKKLLLIIIAFVLSIVVGYIVYFAILLHGDDSIDNVAYITTEPSFLAKNHLKGPIHTIEMKDFHNGKYCHYQYLVVNRDGFLLYDSTISRTASAPSGADTTVISYHYLDNNFCDYYDIRLNAGGNIHRSFHIDNTDYYKDGRIARLFKPDYFTNDSTSEVHLMPHMIECDTVKRITFDEICDTNYLPLKHIYTYRDIYDRDSLVETRSDLGNTYKYMLYNSLEDCHVSKQLFVTTAGDTLVTTGRHTLDTLGNPIHRTISDGTITTYRYTYYQQ